MVSNIKGAASLAAFAFVRGGKVKTVYIAHPFRSNPEQNLRDVMKFIKLAVENGYLPLCAVPVFGPLYGQLDEETVMEMCFKMIDIAQEVWMCGEWMHSEGCLKELEYARNNGKEIYFIGVGYGESISGG